MAKIVIADDHIVLREGIKALMNMVEGWEVIGEADNGLDLIPLVEKHSPEVVILDLRMPQLGGIEAIARLTKVQKQPRILVLSAKDDDLSVGEAMKAGANGFVPKSASGDELKFAVTSLLKGQTYLSPAVCAAVISGNDSDDSILTTLSNREREVMKLISEGISNKEIAKLLHISPRTVDSHRANILKKLGSNSNADLVRLAVKHGMVE